MNNTERLGVKLAPQHKQALARIAQTEDVSEAAIIRRLIRREATERGLWPTTSTTSPAIQTKQNASAAA